MRLRRWWLVRVRKWWVEEVGWAVAGGLVIVVVGEGLEVVDVVGRTAQVLARVREC